MLIEFLQTISKLFQKLNMLRFSNVEIFKSRNFEESGYHYLYLRWFTKIMNIETQNYKQILFSVHWELLRTWLRQWPSEEIWGKQWFSKVIWCPWPIFNAFSALWHHLAPRASLPSLVTRGLDWEGRICRLWYWFSYSLVMVHSLIGSDLVSLVMV